MIQRLLMLTLLSAALVGGLLTAGGSADAAGRPEGRGPDLERHGWCWGC